MASTKPDEEPVPFLVPECGRKMKTAYQVVELLGVTRVQIERLLKQLPMWFRLQQPGEKSPNEAGVPLEVHVLHNILFIGPPKGWVIAYTTMDSWGSPDVMAKLKVDNVMDLQYPGKGQIRTCIHTEARLLRIDGWPNGDQLEINILVYPFGWTGPALI